MRFKILWALAALLPGGISTAFAQQSTQATYSDWIVQCLNEAGPPPKKTCDMAQVTQVQGKNIPFSRVAIEGAGKTRPFKMSVQVPVNVSTRTPITLQISDADPGLLVPFDHCIPAGCFAEFELKDEILKKFLASAGVGKLTFKDAGGHDIKVPLSFKGFRQAFEALSKE